MSCRLRPKNLLQIEKGKHPRGTDTIQFGDDRAFGFSTRGSPRTGKRTKGCCDKRPDEKGPEQLQCRMVRRRRFQHQFYVPPGILPGRFMGRIFTAEKCVKYLVLLATPAGVPRVRYVNDLVLQTAAKSAIEPKKLFDKVTNRNPTLRVCAFLRGHSDGLDLNSELCARPFGLLIGHPPSLDYPPAK